MSIKQHSNVLTLGIIVVVNIIIMAALQFTKAPEEPNLLQEQLRIEFSNKDVYVVDHSNFEALQKVFTKPQQVTEACLTCHESRHAEVLKSSHFNWDRISYIQGRGLASLGKKNAFNNFCIGVAGSEGSCAKCHTGYGLEDFSNFDFTDPNNVDCLSCHTQDADYKKTGGSGLPGEGIDLGRAARQVGKPAIDNCGTCHFYGGGGNNVKHGDLEAGLYSATRDVDVHMGVDGLNMTCVDCHTAENHQMKGKLYSVSSANVNRLTCEDCHTNTPHLTDILNKHTVKVSCQTCHIPEYAKMNPTKMEWYWSEAGHLKDGEPYTVDDEDGQHTYLSTKGTFVWQSNVIPEYVWFNGKADHYFRGDKIDTSAGPVQMNSLFGSFEDSDSKIIPVKVHRGDQIYDTEYLTLIQPKLAESTPGDSAFWADFDWHTASEAGMERLGLPYSGSYDFVETEMYWPVNHMVSKASESLTCASCHTRSEEGRLANLTGFYLPGRDRNKALDGLGRWILILSIFGTAMHGASRVVSYLFITKDLEMDKYEEFEDEDES